METIHTYNNFKVHTVHPLDFSIRLVFFILTSLPRLTQNQIFRAIIVTIIATMGLPMVVIDHEK